MNRSRPALRSGRSVRFRSAYLAILLLAVVMLAPPALAGDDDSPPLGSTKAMDYGPVMAQTFNLAGRGTVPRGLAIRLDHGMIAVFDRELMRYALVVRGGQINTANTDYRHTKGNHPPKLSGDRLLHTGGYAGWAHNGRFKDPRDDGGPLPDSWARFRGYHLHGETVVLSYDVAESHVLERSRAVRVEDRVAWVRHLRVDPSGEKMTMNVANMVNFEEKERGSDSVTLHAPDAQGLRLALDGAPDGATIKVGSGARVELHLPAREESYSFRIAHVTAEQGPNPARAFKTDGDGPTDLRRLTGGGEQLWPKGLSRTGKTGEDKRAYTADRIPVPQENPWGALIRISGVDFFEDGRAAVSTLNGDVWIVSGLDGTLKDVRWKRYAAGLFKPLGLAIYDGQLFVLEQGQISRLHDRNDDGEADFVETFNDDGYLRPMAFWMDLAVDSEGAFYYTRAGSKYRAPERPEYGKLIRVSPDGESSRIYAHGLRQSNGLEIRRGPGPDEILTSDQQGPWVPTTRIDRIEEGGYYGFYPKAPKGTSKDEYDLPICWIPKQMDNSGGSLVYVPNGRWGPLGDHWMHTSWGKRRLFLLLTETVDGVRQGGVVPMPIDPFDAGLARGAAGPHDGQLYIAGLSAPGWSGGGYGPTSFHRIRYTGRPCRLPVGFHARKSGLQIEFASALDPETATDLSNYIVKRWKYRRSKEGNSKHYRLDGSGEGEDSVDVTRATLSESGKTVTLHIPDMKPVQQMKVSYRLRGADYGTMQNELYLTIHRLGP